MRAARCRCCSAVPVAWLASSLPAEHPVVARRARARRHCAASAGQRWTWDGVDFDDAAPAPGVIPGRRARRPTTCRAWCASTRGARQRAAHRRHRGAQRRRAAARARATRSPPTCSSSRTTAAARRRRRRSSRAVAPAVAVFTPGYRNRFGHPRPDVVARYVARGAAVVRTDLDGAITFDRRRPGASRGDRARAQRVRALLARRARRARGAPID